MRKRFMKFKKALASYILTSDSIARNSDSRDTVTGGMEMLHV